MSTELFGPLADVAACEERLVNCWPSHQSVVAGDWLCRFARGYSGRANSAAALRPGTAMTPALLTHIEALYEAAGLRPSIRLTPLVSPETRAMLEARGYAPEDGSLGMVGPATRGLLPQALQLDVKPTKEWLAGACRWQVASKQDTGALLGIVGNLRMPTRYATLLDEGEGAAYGLVSLDRGMAEFGAVMVDPARRGKGLGRQLVQGMIAWAASAGAERMFLQVASDNEVAKALYASLGFQPSYAAAYWRKP